MKESECFVLGTVTKPHGYKGEVVLFIDADEPETYAALEAVWIRVGERLIPHFIETIRPHNAPGKYVVQFDGVDSEEKAKTIAGCAAFAPLALLPNLSGNEFYLHEVAGWEVCDMQNGQTIGTIRRVLEYAIYPILEVRAGENEVLVPLPVEVAIEVDRPNRRLSVALPEGLLEAYLGNDASEEEWDGELDH